MFYEGDLQSGIALAVQQAKSVLCFVRDESPASQQWEVALNDISVLVKTETIALRLNAGSQEASFLSSFCPLVGVPAIVLVKNAVVRLHVCTEGAGTVTLEQLKVQLEAALQRPEASHASLPAVSTTTTPSQRPLQAQAPPMNLGLENPAGVATSTVPPPASYAQPGPSSHVDTASASSTASIADASNSASQAQLSQRADYIKMQKEREQKQRDERERIKQQIKNDREERRKREDLRKQPGMQVNSNDNTSANSRLPKSRDIRVQVRTFDGSTLRQTFAPSAKITSDIRPWVDSTPSISAPYNLKLILTPLPNRTIEPAEEDQSLLDLGIQGSCTLVMVPVKSYVESYAGSSASDILGSAVSGGYNLVTGTAGAVFGSVKSLLGWNDQGDTAATPANSAAGSADDSAPSTQTFRVRTLADQRIEAAKKKDQQFYNGNQLNFEPRKDEGKED